MNQEVVFACDRDFGQTDIIESGEFPFASLQKRGLELINKWNEKVKSRDIAYH
nr:hypothetical protein [uncultured Flavobacterium sp.]